MNQCQVCGLTDSDLLLFPISLEGSKDVMWFCSDEHIQKWFMDDFIEEYKKL